MWVCVGERGGVDGSRGMSCTKSSKRVQCTLYAALACSRVSGTGGGSMDDGRGRMGWAEERESQSPTHLGGGGRVVFMRMLKLQASSFKLKLQAWSFDFLNWFLQYQTLSLR